MRKRTKRFVAHDCRNCKDGTCNNRFIFFDYTEVDTFPPSWAYCQECCAKLGIDFWKQKPGDYSDKNVDKK